MIEDQQRGIKKKPPPTNTNEDNITEMSNGDEDEEDANYYKENIFNKEDYYLFRSVMFFYAGEYEKSILDLESSYNIMHSSKVLYPKNQFPDEDEDNISISNQI